MTTRLSGEPPAYTNWAAIQPNNDQNRGQFYVLLAGFASGADGYWGDVSSDQRGFSHGLVEVTVKPVVVTNQPVARTCVETASLSFAASVSGLVPLAYQWWKDGWLVPDQTNRVCTLVGVEMSDAGAFSLVVSNAFGTVTGLVATLTVLPLAPPAVLAGPVTNPANDHLYYLLGQSSWVEAEAAAEALGGHLATVRSQEEQDWVFSTLGNYGGVFRELYIGFHDADQTHNSTIRGERMSEFVWASGETVTFHHWGAVEPNNFYEKGEFYVHMMDSTGRGKACSDDK